MRDITGEIYKMELDGTVLGKFGKAGKQLKEFSTVHAMDCRNPNEIIVVGDHRVARAEDHPAAGSTRRRATRSRQRGEAEDIMKRILHASFALLLSPRHASRLRRSSRRAQLAVPEIRSTRRRIS